MLGRGESQGALGEGVHGVAAVYFGIERRTEAG